MKHPHTETLSVDGASEAFDARVCHLLDDSIKSATVECEALRRDSKSYARNGVSMFSQQTRTNAIGNPDRRPNARSHAQSHTRVHP